MIKKELKNLYWKERFVYLKDIPFDENDLQQKGSKFQIVKFQPKTSIKPHYHKKTTEIFYVRSGEAIMKFNNEEILAKKDDIFLCQPNDVHEVINNSDEEFVLLIFKTNEEPDDLYWEE